RRAALIFGPFLDSAFHLGLAERAPLARLENANLLYFLGLEFTVVLLHALHDAKLRQEVFAVLDLMLPPENLLGAHQNHVGPHARGLLLCDRERTPCARSRRLL